MLLPGIGWPGGSPENTGIVIGVVIGAYLGALWLAAIVWTVRDIRQRSNDPVTQLVAGVIVLLFNLPGWVLYLVLRPPETLAEIYDRELEEEALLHELPDDLVCPHCESRVESDYVACPRCATSLKAPCDQCERPLSFSWVACPWCGAAREPIDASVSGTVMALEPSSDPVPHRAPREIERDTNPQDKPDITSPRLGSHRSPFERERGAVAPPRAAAGGE
jgi:hypothetical protein